MAAEKSLEMADDSRSHLETAFHDRLLAAVKEVGQCTRAGVQRTLELLETAGGIQTARELLSAKGDSLLERLTDRPGEYFWAAKRVGRMHLSVEAIVLESRWAGLFTPAELEKAAFRLKEVGFEPTLERMFYSQAAEMPPKVVTTGFTRISLGESRTSTAVGLCLSRGEECDITAAQYTALQGGQRPAANVVVRSHLDRCPQCRGRYPDLIAAYEDFDQQALRLWRKLLEMYRSSLRLGDEDLERFVEVGPEDFGRPEEFQDQLAVEVEGFIRPICSWRAVRLGCHIGRFMSAFSRTFAEPGDLWLKWRKGELPGAVSDFVRSMDRELFILGLAARNLLLVRKWAAEPDGALWLPTDGDLAPVAGFLQVDNLTELDDWDEVLGKPPEDVNPLAALYLAEQTAIAQMQACEERGGDEAEAGARQGLVDRIEALMRSQQAALDEIRDRQDVMFSQMERMVAYMPSTDRHACEDALLSELHSIYEKLEPQARCSLLASEQVYRMPSTAAPALIVHALATAFEVQMRHSVLSPLLSYLKARGTPTLLPPSDWTDTEHARAVYSPKLKAEKFTLGEMNRLIRHPAPIVNEHFDKVHLNRGAIEEVSSQVIGPRNEAAHGRSIDLGTAQAIRRDWLGWGGRPGGIFAVLFEAD